MPPASAWPPRTCAISTRCPSNTGDVLHRYPRVLLPEMNLGQLALLLRGRYLVDILSYNRVRGLPFASAEIADAIARVAADEELPR